MGETRRDRRFRLSLGLAVGASLAFVVFLAVRPVGDGSVKLTANLAQLLAPVAGRAQLRLGGRLGVGRPDPPGLGSAGRVGRLLGGRAGHLGVVRAPGPARPALPVFVVVARSRVGGAPVLLLGAGLLSLAVADTSFAYLTQEGAYSTGALSDVGWFAGYPLVATAARGRRRPGSPGPGGVRAGSSSCCPTAPWPWPWPPRPSSSCGASRPGPSCTGRSWPWCCLSSAASC